MEKSLGRFVYVIKSLSWEIGYKWTTHIFMAFLELHFMTVGEFMIYILKVSL